MLNYQFTVTKAGQHMGAGLGVSNTCDIGKKIYRDSRSGNFHMENSQQLKARLEKENK